MIFFSPRASKTKPSALKIVHVRKTLDNPYKGFESLGRSVGHRKYFQELIQLSRNYRWTFLGLRCLGAKALTVGGESKLRV